MMTSHQAVASSCATQRTGSCSNAFGRVLRASSCLCIALLLCASANASDLLLVSRAGQHSPYQDQINAAAKFYGLDIENVAIAETAESSRIAKALKVPDLTAVVLSAGALDLV